MDALEVPNPATGATPAERSRLWWRNILVNSVFVVAWFSFSALLLLYNKALVAEKFIAFPYPLFGTTVQMPIQFALAAACRYGRPRTFKPDNNPSRRDYFTKVVPTAVATGLDIGLGNLSLKIITLSMYTMVKSSSLIFVLGFAFYFGLEKYSLRLVLVVGLISVGVFLMTFHTADAKIGGIMLVLAASALAGFRWAFTQLLLHRSEVGLDSPAATIFWLSPAMGATLAVVSFFVDWWPAMFASGQLARAQTWGLLVIPGVLAFCMVMSEYYLLQRAGIVTTSIVGIFKEVATISLSAWVFGDELTPLKVTGVAVTVSGIALYSWHKYRKTVNTSSGNQAETDEGYALVQGDEHGEELFAIGDEDDAVTPTARRSRGDDAEADSLFERADDDEDARSLRTIGSVGRKWRER